MHVWEDPPPFSLLNHFFLCSLSRLDVNSIVYKKGAIVVLAAEDDLPVFGEAQHVVAVNVDQYYFVVVILHTVCFKPHFHAYEVEHPSIPEYVVVNPTELVDHPPSIGFIYGF